MVQKVLWNTMDGPGDPSLKMVEWEPFPQKEMSNYSGKSTTSTTMQSVLESTNLNKKIIREERITTEEYTIISKQNLCLWYDYKVIFG